MSGKYNVLGMSESISIVEENSSAITNCIGDLPELPRIKMPASPRHRKKYSLEEWHDSR